MTAARPLVATTAFFAAAALAAACGDHLAEPAAPELPTTRAFSPSAPGIDAAACATGPDVVVTTENELRSALSAVSPGDVVAIEGVITLDARLDVDTPDLTLTCASPGSGLIAAEDFSQGFLIFLRGPRIALEALVLESPEVPVTVLGFSTGIEGDGFDARELRLEGNDVVCGWGQCVLLAGVAGSTVAGNAFTAEANFSGIHVQGRFDADRNLISGTDGTRVLGNTLVTENPSLGPLIGGIRIRDGRGVVVSDNEVTGPWANSIAATELDGAVFEGNRLEDATHFGITLSFLPFSEIAVTNSLFRRNEISNPGAAALRISNACDNAFLGNALESGSDATVVFTETTGGNDVFGPVESVIDDGNLDCDGDGIVDPNVVPSAGLVTAGADVGETMQGTMQEVAGIEVR